MHGACNLLKIEIIIIIFIIVEFILDNEQNLYYYIIKISHKNQNYYHNLYNGNYWMFLLLS